MAALPKPPVWRQGRTRAGRPRAGRPGRLECEAVTGTLSALVVAMTGFVGGHFLLSWPPVRSRIVGALGERPFQGVYSLVSVVLLVWAIAAYRAAPFVGLWDLGPAGRVVAMVLVPFALVLAVIGLTTPNPTSVGGERLDDASRAARGIVTITRHPFLCGVTLWAIAHLAASGDAASTVLFAGMLILAVGGMAAIDHKRALRMGDAWRAIAAKTSVVPFAATAAGRVRVDWKGIGWWRPALGVAVYLILLFGHGWLFGPALIPG